jgi:hypothetical protein
MCKAFSALVRSSGEVLWKFGVDSHEDLVSQFHLQDLESDRSRLKFARVEITPANGNYLDPDKWNFRLDEEATPTWWSPAFEQFAWDEHRKWLRKLDKILVKKPIVNPFTVTPPKKITRKHLRLLRTWNSVWNSVRDSVRNSVWNSVGYSVGNSVRNSVGNSVRDSVRAYAGSFFHLPRKSWKGTDKIPGKGYPFQSAVDLWELGLVPSWDGTTWRLHGGTKAEILWSGTVEELKAGCR